MCKAEKQHPKLEYDDCPKAVLDKCLSADGLGFELKRVDVHQVVLVDEVLYYQTDNYDDCQVWNSYTKDQPKGEYGHADCVFEAEVVVPVLKLKFMVLFYHLLEAVDNPIEVLKT